MKKIIFILSMSLLLSCSNDLNSPDQESVSLEKATEEKSNPILDPRSVDPQVSEMFFNSSAYSKTDVFELYNSLSELENGVLRDNSKTISLMLLNQKGFIENASLSDIEYIIKDQSTLSSNTATININYKLFFRAFDLGSKMDLKSLEKEFVTKNTLSIQNISDKNKGDKAERLVSQSQLFNIKSLNL